MKNSIQVIKEGENIKNEEVVLQEGATLEPEKFFGEQLTFNHQQLVMTGIAKTLELGSKELREGWWEEKVDKMGNVLKTYHEDTRKAFIESVKSLLMVISCDFDPKAKVCIEKLDKQIKNSKDYWLKEEWDWWEGLPKLHKDYLTSQGKNVIKGFFNQKLPFDNYFFEEELEFYRQIATECNNLTKRLNFYESSTFVA